MDRMVQLVIAVVVVVAAVIALASFSSQPQEDGKIIKIGIIAPLTGPVPTCGEDMKLGIDLAAGEINKDKKKIEFVYEDDRFDTKESVNIANKFIFQDNIKIIIGACSSSATLAIAPIAEENKVILFTPISFADKISEAGDYVFRAKLRASEGSPTVADFIKNKLNTSRAAVVYLNNDFGLSYLNNFKRDFEQLGGSVILSQAIEAPERDFRTVLLKIKENNVSLIFAPLTSEPSITMIRQADELGMNITFFGTDILEREEVFTALGELSDDIFIVASSDFSEASRKASPEIDIFVKRLQTEFNKKPNAQRSDSYDVTKLLALAIEVCNEAIDCIKNELYKIENYRGASGLISIDKNGDVVHQSVLIKIARNREFVRYEED